MCLGKSALSFVSHFGQRVDMVVLWESREMMDVLQERCVYVHVTDDQHCFELHYHYVRLMTVGSFLVQLHR